MFLYNLHLRPKGIDSKKFVFFFPQVLPLVYFKLAKPLKHEYLVGAHVKDDRFQPQHLLKPADLYAGIGHILHFHELHLCVFAP